MFTSCHFLYMVWLNPCCRFTVLKRYIQEHLKWKTKNKKQKLTFYDLHVFSSFWAEQDNMAAIFLDVCQSLLYRPVMNIYKSRTSSSAPNDRMYLTCDAPRYWLNHDMYRVRFSKTENNNNNKKKKACPPYWEHSELERFLSSYIITDHKQQKKSILYKYIGFVIYF